MRICAISDLHGYLPVLPESDLLLIAGDIMPLRIQDNIERSLEWLENEFQLWAKDQDTYHVILVGGNHDMILESRPEEIKKIFKSYNEGQDFEWFHYLENETKTITVEEKDVTIFGTPYCKEFGRWAFMRPDEELTKLFKQCPDYVDLIVSHDAPYGVTDVLLEKSIYSSYGENLGSKPLREMINRVDFKYMVHGHLHSTRHSFEEFKSGKVANVSLLSEEYKPVYPPLLFDYEY